MQLYDLNKIKASLANLSSVTAFRSRSKVGLSRRVAARCTPGPYAGKSHQELGGRSTLTGSSQRGEETPEATRQTGKGRGVRDQRDKLLGT